MASNIILAVPTENTTIPYTLPEGDSAKLSIASSDIVGLKMNGGQLVIDLKEGGSIAIENFQSFIDGGNTLSLADGIDVDPKLLGSALGANNDNALGAMADATRIGVPAEGTTREISLEQGKKYLFDFDISQTQGANVENGVMTIAFANGSKIVIPNYDTAMAGELPPELSLTSKTCVVTAEELITNIQNLANSGVVEETIVVVEEEEAPQPKSKLESADLEGQDDIGPGDETAQQYQAEQPKPEEVANVEPAAGDEAELIAQRLEAIEPAAGGTTPAGRGGYGYNSAPGSDPFQGRPDIGPIGPTSLGYRAPEVEPNRVFFTPAAAPINPPVFAHVVDETDMNGGTTDVSGDINVNFGSDGPSTTVPPYQFTGAYNEQGSIDNNILSSNGVPVNVLFTPGSATGWANGVKVFDLIMNTDTGEYTFTLYQQLDHADGADPNDGIVFSFGVVATDDDGDALDVVIQITVLDDAPFVGEDEQTVDETAFSLVNPLVATGNVGPDYGEDGPGSLTTGGFTASGSLDNNVLSSGGVAVVVTPGVNSWTGTANGVTVFTLTFDPNTGNYTYTQYKPLDHADPDDDNDIITLTFDLLIKDYDEDTDPGKIVIHVRDDAPFFPPPPPPPGGGNPNPGDGYNIVDETNLTAVGLTVNGDLNANFGADVPGSYAFNNSFDSTGSKLGGNLTSNGVPVVVSIVGGAYVGTAGGVEVFRLTLNTTTGEYEFTLKDNLDHADGTNPNDVIRLTFGVDGRDSEGDAASGTIVIDVRDDAPVLADSAGSVDESNLGPNPLVFNGDMVENFGKDGPGTITTTGIFTPGGSLDNGVLTSGGQPITVTPTVNGYTGTIPGGEVIFTLTINSATGAYTYTQYKGLDHDDPNDPNDTITLTFGAQITDYDGDSDPANIVITVADDAPRFPPPPPPPGGGNPNPGDGYNVVDETNLVPAGLVVTGDLQADFGADVPGSYAFNNSFNSSGSKLGGNLTSNGQPVVVSIVGGAYVGVANGVEVFRLTLNTTTGEYTFTLKDTLDHANGADPNDVIRLTFGVNASDSEGDSATGTIVIDVVDDAPVANDDGRTVDEGQTITGDVTANDNEGNDLPSDVIQVIFNGVPTNVPANGSDINIVGTYGTLTINKTGAYSYTANQVAANGVDNFTYVLRDFDGDTDPAVLSIEVINRDSTPDIIKPAPEVVDETNLPGGIIETGTVIADFKTDGPGTFQPTGSFTSSGSQLGGNLTHNGTPIVVTLVGDTYQGVAGGVTIFTMQIETDGDYTFRLFENIDHADGSNPNDIITLDFGVKAVDADGDEASTTITVNVLDDAPTITGSGGSVDESDLGPNPLVFNGDLTEDFGEDGPGTISTTGTFTPGGSLDNGVLTSGGVAVVVTPTANGYTGTANGVTVFTLTINPTTGAYTYTQYKALDHADDTNPNDIITLTFGAKITDYDGDTDDANIVINVVDDAPRFPPPPPPPGGGNPDPGDGYNIVDETNLVPAGLVVTDTVVADFGADVPGTYALNTTFDSSGSKLGGNLTSNGVPVTVNLVGGEWVGTANGTEVFRLSINPTSGQYTFTLKDTLDHADGTNPNDLIRLTFGVDARDSEGEKASGTIVIDIVDDAPIITGATNIAREEDLGPVVKTGNLGIDFNNDGPGAVATTGAFSASGSVNGGVLASNGVPIVVNSNATGYTGTANGVTIFTLTINPQTGAYTFTLFDKLDHADPTDPNDVIDLTFGVKITDYDGDTDTANVVISVVDDGPVIDLTPIITKPIENVDESNLASGAITETGTVVVDYQGEGPGTVGTTGTFTSGGSKLGGNLTSNGHTVTVTHNNGTYTGTANGVTIFTLTVAANGQYTFRLFEQLDHANGSDPNDVIALNFGISATDADGDTVTSTLTVNVADDAPLASRDDCTIFVHEGSYASNLISNDTVGQDIPGRISAVSGSFGTVQIASSGETTVQGQYGTLRIKADGSYTYTLKSGVSHGSIEQFTYTLKDFDGDSSSANLTISILANMNGTNVNDTIHGTSAGDTIFGNGATDYLYGEGGNDYIDGGTENDRIEGNQGNDTILGGSGNDLLYGDEPGSTYVGHDTIYGGDGNDGIVGGRGNDVLYGGSGADKFWFMSINDGLDTIKDFNIGEGDKLELSNILTNPSVTQANIDQFVYATHSGGNTTIHVNPNGTGMGGATALVVLEGVTVTVDQLKTNGAIID